MLFLFIDKCSTRSMLYLQIVYKKKVHYSRFARAVQMFRAEGEKRRRFTCDLRDFCCCCCCWVSTAERGEKTIRQHTTCLRLFNDMNCSARMWKSICTNIEMHFQIVNCVAYFEECHADKDKMDKLFVVQSVWAKARECGFCYFPRRFSEWRKYGVVCCVNVIQDDCLLKSGLNHSKAFWVWNLCAQLHNNNGMHTSICTYKSMVAE